MSRNRFEINGLRELRQALLDLPAALTNDATTIVQGHANTAADRARAAYPRKTGAMASSVEVHHFGATYSSRSTVINTDPGAMSYEVGSERFKHVPHPTLIPIIREERREMYRELIDVVTRAGFQVTGVDLWNEAGGEHLLI